MIHRGIFAVYKPPGVTSAKVAGTIRKILQQFNSSVQTNSSTSSHRSQLKVGHGGTLDKFAEGVLVIGIGSDCKQLGHFQKNTIKCYSVVGQLGMATDTLDASGTLMEESPWQHVARSELIQATESFVGEIRQTPPIFSALRLKGKRFSDLVREANKRGEKFTKMPEPRTVNIRSVSVEMFKPPLFELNVTCSSGTYVRSLIRDIGLKLDTVAHVVSLVRTRQGPFEHNHTLEKSQWTVSDIQQAIKKHCDNSSILQFF